MAEVISFDEQAYEIIDVPRDGNCFFSTLSLGLTSSLESAHSLRQIITSEILQAWNQYKELISIYQDFSWTKEKYRLKMKEGGDWATQLEIQVAANLFKKKIVVHAKTEKTNKYLTIETVPEHQTNVENSTMHVILSMQEGHYYYLRKM